MWNSSSSLPVELSSRDGFLSPRRRTRGRGEQNAGLCGGGSGVRGLAPIGVVNQRQDTAELEDTSMKEVRTKPVVRDELPLSVEGEK